MMKCPKGTKIRKPRIDKTVQNQKMKVKRRFAKQKHTGKPKGRRRYLPKPKLNALSDIPTGGMSRISLIWVRDVEFALEY